jgi:ribosomal-protein-alanine N-acetyltransferase
MPDPAALAALHARCFTRPRPWSVAAFTALLADPAVVAITRPEGFALGRVTLDEAELQTIAIDLQHRQAGLGRALLADWLSAVAQQGALQVFLEVAEDNAPARALYARAGFTKAGRRRGYYRDAAGTCDALVLRLALSPVDNGETGGTAQNPY